MIPHRPLRTTSITVAFLIFLAGSGAASPIGDPIDHQTALFHGPAGDTFNTGPGAPIATMFLGTPPGGTHDLVADFTTGTTLGWHYVRIDISGGFDSTTMTSTLPSVLPAASVLTHDIEDLLTPGAQPFQIAVWGSNFSQPPGLGFAQQAFGSLIYNPLTAHDVDGSLFGFDLGINIAQPGLLLTPPASPPPNEFYVVAFTFTAPGGPPQTLFPNTELITVVPEPGTALLMGLGLAILGLGRQCVLRIGPPRNH